MPFKKKKISNKKEVKKKEVKTKFRRRLLPSTFGKLPFAISKIMPQAASAVPLVSKAVPLVSGAIPLVSGYVPLVSTRVPLVSNVGRVTLPVAWKLLPPREWGKIKIPVTRKRRIPTIEISLTQFLAALPAAPFAPLVAIKKIAEAVKEQAEEEKNPKVALEQELLELKMRFEMGEITKDDFKIKETELKRQIKDMEEKEDAQEPKEKSKKRKKKGGTLGDE